LLCCGAVSFIFVVQNCSMMGPHLLCLGYRIVVLGGPLL
jgi:hypothetical protein